MPFKPVAFRRIAATWAQTMKPANLTRRISSLKHLTQAEMKLLMQHWDASSHNNNPSPPSPVSHTSLKPVMLQPQEYSASLSRWTRLGDQSAQKFDHGSLIKVISWNIHWSGPAPEVRASAMLEHLKSRIEGSTNLIVMLQEVCSDSLQAILDNQWVRSTFALSNTEPPDSICKETLGQSFVMRTTEWEAAPYFSLMMITKDLPVADCFQVPLKTSMGRYALAVDIPLSTKGPDAPKESVRLCTSHLESLWEGRYYRSQQLAQISTLLKCRLSSRYKVVAGLVGGDMNAIEQLDHCLHTMEAIQLRDVWEDVPASPIPILKPFQKDLSYGQARGNTWGYQSNGPRNRQRLDKFFYTGPIETVAISEAQDVTGRLGRLGIGLKVEVEAWEEEQEVISLRRGKYVSKIRKNYLGDRLVARLRERRGYKNDKLIRTTTNAWVSDHFGITVGIRVLATGTKRHA